MKKPGPSEGCGLSDIWGEGGISCGGGGCADSSGDHVDIGCGGASHGNGGDSACGDTNPGTGRGGGVPVMEAR